MCKSICGAECSNCGMQTMCKGCEKTGGCPFGEQCFVAKYISVGGMDMFLEFKKELINEFNELHIPGMPKVAELYTLMGNFVNLEYTLPNGQVIKLLNDNSIYLGNQMECEGDRERCYGIVGNLDFLVVCTYGENGQNPELIMYKKR